MDVATNIAIYCGKQHRCFFVGSALTYNEKWYAINEMTLEEGCIQFQNMYPRMEEC